MASYVRIKEHVNTFEHNLANMIGIVHGETVPSLSHVDVIIGDGKSDYALYIYFEELKQGFWFSEELIELVKNTYGDIATIGNLKYQLQADGTWKDISENIVENNFKQKKTPKFWVNRIGLSFFRKATQEIIDIIFYIKYINNKK